MDVIQKLAPFVIEEGIKHVSKNLNSPSSELATEASRGNTHAIKSMLSKNPSINRGPAMVAAASAGYLGALDVLLEPPKSSSHDHDHDRDQHHHHQETIDVNVWASGTTPLLAAVKEHHVKTTRTLLEAGADPELEYKNGTTAIQEAARAGEAEIVRLLAKAGANVDHHNADGDTALIIAARWGQTAAAKVLIEEDANVNARNAKHSTALLVAARHDNTPIIELLLRNGANVNARDRQGRGALHRAVAGMWLIEGVPVSVKERIVEMLLNAGADPTMTDLQGKTAADRAGWFQGDERLRKLLESKIKTFRRKYDPKDRDRRRAQTF
jgi:ankyrin repeat protein